MAPDFSFSMLGHREQLSHDVVCRGQQPHLFPLQREHAIERVLHAARRDDAPSTVAHGYDGNATQHQARVAAELRGLIRLDALLRHDAARIVAVCHELHQHRGRELARVLAG
eukprot:scaffold1415_cov117-Isochrysis_galbana.AAC.3